MKGFSLPVIASLSTLPFLSLWVTCLPVPRCRVSRKPRMRTRASTSAAASSSSRTAPLSPTAPSSKQSLSRGMRVLLSSCACVVMRLFARQGNRCILLLRCMRPEQGSAPPLTQSSVRPVFVAGTVAGTLFFRLYPFSWRSRPCRAIGCKRVSCCAQAAVPTPLLRFSGSHSFGLPCVSFLPLLLLASA